MKRQSTSPDSLPPTKTPSLSEAYNDLQEKLRAECLKAKDIPVGEVEASVAAAKREAEATKEEIREWKAQAISAIDKRAAELTATVDEISKEYSMDCLFEESDLDWFMRMALEELPEGMPAGVLMDKAIVLNKITERVKKANVDATKILSSSIDFHFVSQLKPIKDCANECAVECKKIYQKRV